MTAEENSKLQGKIKTYFRDEIIFDSDFDSANLSAVVEIPKSEFDYEFNLWTAPDCAGTEYENSNRSWFYFGVRGGTAGGQMLLNIVNLNRQVKLYQQGMTPVYRQRGQWERMKERPNFEMGDWGMRLSFFHTIPSHPKLTTYYAFCYPHSYTDCQKRLERIEMNLTKSESQIYYHRELATLSLDGRRVDLITVSSLTGLTEEREPRLEGLFPSEESRAHVFEGKKVYVLSSRVHPGEVPGSHIFNGFLDFIINSEDLRAHRLREKFVFKLIPLLNPDGVARGHYRMDQRGANLNRYYLNPDPVLHPSVFALRSIVMYHHSRGDSSLSPTNRLKKSELPLVHFRLDTRDPFSPCETPDPLTTQENSGVAIFVDLHGHAAKRGCFIYGNHFDDVTVQTENMLYPKLVSLNSPNFDFGYCVFSEKNMYWKDKRDGLSKEGSARVGIYKATGIIRSYTLECNYNTGRLCNTITTAEPSGRSTPPHHLNYPPKFTIPVLEELGKSLAIAALDLFECNPWPRIRKSQYNNLHGIRQSITEQIINSRSCREQFSTSSVNGYSLRAADSKKLEENSVLHLIHSKPNNLTSRSNSRAFNTPIQPYIPNAIPVTRHTDRPNIKLTNEELTKPTLTSTKSRFQNNSIQKYNPSTYKQLEIRCVTRRVSDRPVSEAAPSANRGLIGKKDKTTKPIKKLPDRVEGLLPTCQTPHKATSLVIGLDLATLFPIDCRTPPTPKGYLSASPIKKNPIFSHQRGRNGDFIVKEKSMIEHNTLCVEGIEGKDIVDKHFSSEEIKLVKRLPKTLQEKALKCLKEQKLMSEKTQNLEQIKIIDSSRHNDKLINGFLISEKTPKKSKIRKNESTSLSRVQPISNNFFKSTRYQTVSTKRTFKINNN